MSDKKHNPYDVDSENLAVPEIHTDHTEKTEKEKEEHEIDYDNLAIPEIHFHKPPKKDK